MGRKPTFYWETLAPEYLWYLVGLIASDGSLSKDGRHIDITSSDLNYLKKLKLSLEIKSCISRKYGGFASGAWHIQIGSKSFYNFLLSIGLTPNKAKTLGKLDVKKDSFPHFFRGLIDGDGCIRRWIHPTNLGEQWSLRIYGSSKDFMEWLKMRCMETFSTKGRIHRESQENQIKYTLKFGKLAAQKILQKCYNNASLKLDRKFRIANECIQTKRGWSKSKTVIN